MCVTVIQGSVYVPDNVKLWFFSLSGRVVQKMIEVIGHELGEYGALAALWVVVGMTESRVAGLP